ncbi:RHS repeat domain-containing protein [Bdellovibrio reynosensis]|uniref:RHS repeat protein n=1 Tax=Bdellovibrio reynosensis TaxID=2835041 RepID=A0ABY4C7P0_9BACT|nr:RHS repeat domain-containing protein [Bdellovibrio reynosensis]UOF00903.1 RHS repeat protein [Bdellovibrio reynosensis]
MKNLCVSLFILASSITAQAMVDTSSGSYIHSWIDFEKPGLELAMKLERTYNSRSNRTGWFGYGWCTDLETSIDVSENGVHFVYCGAGRDVTFRKKGSSFVSKDPSMGVFTKEGSTYIRTLKDGTREKYNNGVLTEIAKGEVKLFFKYQENGLPKEIVDNEGRKVVFTTQKAFVTKAVFVTKKQDGTTPLINDLGKYEYKDDLLVRTVNSWGNAYSYAYDKDKNMVKAVWPGNQKVEMTYSTSSDWITGIKGDGICSEVYDYKLDSSKTPPKYAVVVKKVCVNNTTIEKSYSYQFSGDTRRVIAHESDNEGIQRRYKFDDQGNVIEVTEERPRGSVTTKVQRNNKGLISKVSNSFEARSYVYKTGGSTDLTVKVVKEMLAFGKSVGSEEYLFTYNENDLMIGVTGPDKVKVTYKYDDRNRLTQITKKDLVIDVLYEESSASPIVLKLAGQKVPLSLNRFTATAPQVAALESYYDHARMADLSVPYY